MNLLSIENVIFTSFGYQMSLVEFLGTIFNLWSVWLVGVGSILTWPAGIVGVVLFGILFYQIQLYSDLLEQIYFLITGVIGWWMWKGSVAVKDTNDLLILRNTKKENFIWLAIICLATVILSMMVSRIHLWFPDLFLVPASYPFLDALTTAISFIAQWLMAKRRLESWILWILVDVIGIGLYFSKGVVFVSILYGIFLLMAVKGLHNWFLMWKKKQ